MTDEDRFWAKVERNPEGCWGWKGRKDRQGYGRFSLSRRHSVGAHRFSWMLHFGPIPPGKRVLHRCDNPPCTNPTDLFLGTDLDNVADRDAKGRTQAGERHYAAKLTEAKVAEIRRLRMEGWTQIRLATAYGVAKSQVWRILQGKNWRASLYD